ncbi:peptidoglycan-binding domain-containing protein [Azohydromonas caseinilytica]|uniref:Peptidoglycan-binding protein n=1 Tax=Azohydromonas caseinilytica TaxID=2728836 RepID=A0A848F789_9BURK|nr:peptidoglycan-binding protein [Azohydromonas caseinilytica]
MVLSRRGLLINRDTVKAIQLPLINKGFIPGEVDGIWGRRTIAVVKDFQAAAGLDMGGIVGPKTSAALCGGMTVSPQAPCCPGWLRRKTCSIPKKYWDCLVS